MNILFNMGSLKKGGAERVASNLCNFLVKDNDISIMTSIKENSYYKLNNNINLYNLDENRPEKNFLKKNIKRLKKMNLLVKKIKPDIIISFLPEPSYRILFLKIFNPNIKVIVSVRNDPKVEYSSIKNRMIMKLLYPLADGFVFQTQEAKEYFSKKIQDKSVIIPNPINEEFICEPYTGKREKIIVTVGRLEKQKNHKMLIEAFSKLPEELNEYKLIIYGEGSLRPELEKQIKELNLSDRVFLPGQVDDIKNKIYKASLFVLSSDYEGMPNALMEAMALGIPCISTDCPCGGPRFLICSNKNGILVKINNSEKMENKIEYILKNENIRNKMGREAIKIREDLNPDNINNEWKKFAIYTKDKR